MAGVDVRMVLASAIVLDDGLPQDPPPRILDADYSDDERDADNLTDDFE